MTDLQRIISFISRNHVLTVCSANDGTPWAASCFYAFDFNRIRFLILTSLETRHGAEMVRNARVAGTVSAQQSAVATIRGLQFAGTSRQLEGDEAEQGRAIYYRKFSFARLRPAPIWTIDPEILKLTDNRLGFGTKIIWTRPED